MDTYFELALNEAMQGIENDDGAPFGGFRVYTTIFCRCREMFDS